MAQAAQPSYNLAIDERKRMSRGSPGRLEGWIQASIVVAVLGWSAVGPVSIGTWAMEIAWVAVGLPLIVYCFVRGGFRLSRLLCWLLVVHAIVLIYGGHYTYAETPLGDWLRELLDTQRNNYDRIGHFIQGFVPAILYRELLIRLSPLRPGKLLFTMVTACAVAFSAVFEMLEWAAALALGADADAYLATQGDVWDTQWDMFLALCGAVIAQLLLSYWHNRQLRILAPR